MNTAVGVLIGLAASAVSGLAAFWWKSKRDLKMAAAQCYDRLIKLEQAQGLPNDQRSQVISNEANRLGAHMDLYLASLSAVLLTRSRQRHWDAYERMIPILISKDLNGLGTTIDHLAPLVKAPPRRPPTG